MFIREIGRSMDWGEYDVDVVVVPTKKGKEDLAEASAGGYNMEHATVNATAHQKKTGIKSGLSATTIENILPTHSL